MEYPTDGATYLKVPYERREEAKAIGARWDAQTKHWYLPAGQSKRPARALGFLIEEQSTA